MKTLLIFLSIQVCFGANIVLKSSRPVELKILIDSINKETDPNYRTLLIAKTKKLSSVLGKMKEDEEFLLIKSIFYKSLADYSLPQVSTFSQSYDLEKVTKRIIAQKQALSPISYWVIWSMIAEAKKLPLIKVDDPKESEKLKTKQKVVSAWLGAIKDKDATQINSILKDFSSLILEKLTNRIKLFIQYSSDKELSSPQREPLIFHDNNEKPSLSKELKYLAPPPQTPKDKKTQKKSKWSPKDS